MPLTKAKPDSNMYSWITHHWSCLCGECNHRCSYCFIRNFIYTKNSPNFKGPLFFNPKDEYINLGKDRVIFVCHTNDLFLADENIVLKVLRKCLSYSGNQYVFQTKNPEAAYKYCCFIPSKSYFGTTVETDLDTYKYSSAPTPISRLKGIQEIKEYGDIKTFITIEPIMRFSPDFPQLIINAKPDFVNIGADSKRCNLPEPKKDQIEYLIKQIQKAGIEIRKKTNLERLL
jgi:DNA repair photolyase